MPLNQDQRREALEAYRKARKEDDVLCSELAWLRSWEMATEAAYQECANACDVNGDLLAADLIRQVVAKG